MLEHQDIGVLLLLVKSQSKIKETPVNMLPRKNGQSRIFKSWRFVFIYMLHTLALALAKRRLFHNLRQK